MTIFGFLLYIWNRLLIKTPWNQTLIKLCWLSNWVDGLQCLSVSLTRPFGISGTVIIHLYDASMRFNNIIPISLMQHLRISSNCIMYRTIHNHHFSHYECVFTLLPTIFLTIIQVCSYCLFVASHSEMASSGLQWINKNLITHINLCLRWTGNPID